MDIKKETEKYILTWSNQGRSEDQIWAVRNFMTGQGFLMLNDLKEGLIEELREKVLGLEPTCSAEWDEWKDGHEDAVGQILDRLDSLKGEKGSK